MSTYISVSHKHTAKHCIISQFHTNIKATAPYQCFFVTYFMYVALLLRTGVVKDTEQLMDSGNIYMKGKIYNAYQVLTSQLLETLGNAAVIIYACKIIIITELFPVLPLQPSQTPQTRFCFKIYKSSRNILSKNKAKIILRN